MAYMPQSLFSFPQISFAIVEGINSSCKAGINGLTKAFRSQSAVDARLTPPGYLLNSAG